MKSIKVAIALFILAVLLPFGAKVFAQNSQHSHPQAGQPASKQQVKNEPMAMSTGDMMTHHKEMIELVERLRQSIDAIESEKEPAALKQKLSEHRRMIERLQAGMNQCSDMTQQMAEHMKTCPMMKSQHKHE